MDDIERVAKLAAKETVKETFLALGVDISDPISAQHDFAFLRGLRYTVRHARNVIIAAVVSGGAWIIWTVANLGKAAGK